MVARRPEDRFLERPGRGWLAHLRDESGRERAVRLTQGPVTDREPDWSPDGTRIVFVHDGNIAVMNADGTGLTNLTNLTNFSIFNSNSSPAWSPSGQKIAYASASDHRIYLMSADGSNPSPLVTTADQQYGPAWSPDGAQIAF